MVNTELVFTRTVGAIAYDLRVATFTVPETWW